MPNFSGVAVSVYLVPATISFSPDVVSSALGGRRIIQRELDATKCYPHTGVDGVTDIRAVLEECGRYRGVEFSGKTIQPCTNQNLIIWQKEEGFINGVAIAETFNSA